MVFIIVTNKQIYKVMFSGEVTVTYSPHTSNQHSRKNGLTDTVCVFVRVNLCRLNAYKYMLNIAIDKEVKLYIPIHPEIH